jgi:hypothetical protein
MLTSAAGLSAWTLLTRLGALCLVTCMRSKSNLLRRAFAQIELVNIFETFLPQLLRYPNPADPLNGEAARLMLHDPVAYNLKIRLYVEKYAPRTSRSLDDLKEPDLGPRKDSSATTDESRASTHHAVTHAQDDVDGYMSEASELSDL